MKRIFIYCVILNLFGLFNASGQDIAILEENLWQNGVFKETFDKCREVLKDDRKRDPEELARTILCFCYSAHAIGCYTSDILKLIESANDILKSECAESRLTGIADILFCEQYAISDQQKALYYGTKACQTLNKISDANFEAALAEYSLGYIYMLSGDNARAMQHTEKSISIFQTAGLEKHWHYPIALATRAYILVLNKQFEEAADGIEMAMNAVMENGYAKSEAAQPTYGVAMLVYMYCGAMAETINIGNDAIDIMQKHQWPISIQYAQLYYLFGVAYARMIELEKCYQYFELSKNIYEKLEETNNYGYKNLMDTWAKVFKTSKD